MAPHENFDGLFKDKAAQFPHEKIDKAIKIRREYDGLLFIDRLFKVLGVKNPTKIYPPQTPHDLRKLMATILSATAQPHHQQSLIYYLLLSMSTEAARDFTRSVNLPSKYRLYIQGIQALDNQDFGEAMEYLTEPSLLPTFSDEVLSVLIRHTEKKDKVLALAYYNCVQPPLATTKVLNEYFLFLCSANLQSAFVFARARDTATHRALLNSLITSTLSRSTSGDVRSARSMQLINLPFSIEEEEWFEDCLLNGEGRNCHGAMDTAVVRRLVRGEGVDDLEGGRTSGGKIGGMDWGDVVGGFGTSRIGGR